MAGWGNRGCLKWVSQEVQQQRHELYDDNNAILTHTMGEGQVNGCRKGKKGSKTTIKRLFKHRDFQLTPTHPLSNSYKLHLSLEFSLGGWQLDRFPVHLSRILLSPFSTELVLKIDVQDRLEGEQKSNRNQRRRRHRMGRRKQRGHCLFSMFVANKRFINTSNLVPQMMSSTTSPISPCPAAGILMARDPPPLKCSLPEVTALKGHEHWAININCFVCDQKLCRTVDKVYHPRSLGPIQIPFLHYCLHIVLLRINPE